MKMKMMLMINNKKQKKIIVNNKKSINKRKNEIEKSLIIIKYDLKYKRK